MPAAIPIVTTAIALAGTAYSIKSSSDARKDAQGAADQQAKTQQADVDRQKAQAATAEQQKQVGVVAGQQKIDQQNKQGYNSTVSTTPQGLTGVGVTGGQKTLLGS